MSHQLEKIRSRLPETLKIFWRKLLFPFISLISWVFGYIFASIGSLYGITRLSNVSDKNCKIIHDAHKHLVGKRVLILGTGPSASLITSDYVKNFDHIVLLNHAISMVPNLMNNGFTKEKISFFCADRNRVKEVSHSLKKNILPYSNSIFFPDFPYSVLLFDLKGIRALLIGGWKKWNVKYIGPYRRQGWQISFNEIPMLEMNVKASYDRYMSSDQLKPPYIPYTVAFSCILFFSLYRPRDIHLLGCDFSGDFRVYPMIETFDMLVSWLGNYGIELHNDSLQ